MESSAVIENRLFVVGEVRRHRAATVCYRRFCPHCRRTPLCLFKISNHSPRLHRVQECKKTSSSTRF
eukprot:m.35863 g.35863  ORF g.35863 m.35863 type:complete len:67 (+) comp7493_c0_seq1:1340-1540(+)